MVVPEWLHASDLWASLYSGSVSVPETNTEDKGDNTRGDLELSVLPQCELDCGDALRLYIVMGTWCFSWDRVPKTVFFPLWRALAPDQRRKAIVTYLYFAEELDEDQWMKRIYERDDVELYRMIYLGTASNMMYISFAIAEVTSNNAFHCFQHIYETQVQLRYWDWAFYDRALVCNRSYLKKVDWIRYMYEHGRPWRIYDIEQAALGGYKDCLRYMHEHGAPMTDRTCESAAIGGNLDCLKYTHNHGSPWNEGTCASAAMCGNLYCLRYLHEQGCPWDISTCNAAAGRGNVSCLKYAHTHGCAWDATTCTAAAIHGQLKILRYLHTHQCPWDTNTCFVAANHGHVKCLMYAHQNGCPWTQWEYLDIHTTPRSALCLVYANGQTWGSYDHQLVDAGGIHYKFFV